MICVTRLIDADALREDWLQNGENEYVYDANAFIESIDDMPTVDAVPVVRCKDCEYGHEPSILIKGMVECERSCSGECLKREDWYCPLGKHRDGD